MSYGIVYARGSYRNEFGDRVTTTRVLAENTREAREAYEAELTTRPGTDAYARVDVDLITSTDDIARVTAGYWFKPDTMRSFGTRILSGQRIIGHKFYFVSSEWTGFERTGRAYSVRVWDADADSMDTVGEFGQYSSAAQARRAMERIGQYRTGDGKYFRTSDEAIEHVNRVQVRTGSILGIEIS